MTPVETVHTKKLPRRITGPQMRASWVMTNLNRFHLVFSSRKPRNPEQQMGP